MQLHGQAAGKAAGHDGDEIHPMHIDSPSVEITSLLHIPYTTHSYFQLHNHLEPFTGTELTHSRPHSVHKHVHYIKTSGYIKCKSILGG